jgi:aryl-alcohol dehydrogenase-like predicted oxidoreductase
MPLSLAGRPSQEQAIATIHRALDLGVNLIDTADSYCLDEAEKHHNERLIAQALRQYSRKADQLTVVTKGGYLRPGGDWVANGNPDYLRRTLRASFEALGGEKPIDLWLLHVPDPHYSMQQSLTAAKAALAEGIVRSVGLSNVSLRQLHQAREVVEIAAVENQYNLWHRQSEFDGLLSYCEQAGLLFLAWSPLGGIGGKRRTRPLQSLTVLNDLARQKGVSVYGLLLAWLQAKSPAVVPIVGARRVASIEDSVKSVQIQLTPAEVKIIDAARPLSLSEQPAVVWIKRQLKQLLRA